MIGDNLRMFPVHGGIRAYAFFDGHVSTLSLLRHPDSMTTRPFAGGWISVTQ